MSRAAITPVKATAIHSQPELPVALTEAACDASNFNSFVNDGRTILILRNSGASSRTFKVYDLNGTQVGTTRNLLSGKTYVFGPFPQREYGATVNYDCSHAEIVAVAAQLVHPGVLSAVS